MRDGFGGTGEPAESQMGFKGATCGVQGYLGKGKDVDLMRYATGLDKYLYGVILGTFGSPLIFRNHFPIRRDVTRIVGKQKRS